MTAANMGAVPSLQVSVNPAGAYTPGPAANGDGSVAISGANGTAKATALNPIPVAEAQGVIASGPMTLVADTPLTLIAAFADRRGMRVLNYTASPVYLTNGITGTPPSGAGSDFIPAAVGAVPGVWEPRYAPVNGVRAVGAAAGGLTITVW